MPSVNFSGGSLKITQSHLTCRHTLACKILTLEEMLDEKEWHSSRPSSGRSGIFLPSKLGQVQIFLWISLGRTCPRFDGRNIPYHTSVHSRKGQILIHSCFRNMKKVLMCKSKINFKVFIEFSFIIELYKCHYLNVMLRVRVK